jgi:hypothetical protein
VASQLVAPRVVSLSVMKEEWEALVERVSEGF